jgi:glucose-6-phosphate isomerase
VLAKKIEPVLVEGTGLEQLDSSTAALAGHYRTLRGR